MYTDKEKINPLLKTAKGQIEGVLKMVEEDRYCLDISNQLLATIAILKKINFEILNGHLHNCVLNSTNEDLEQKLTELSVVLGKLLK